MPTSSQLSPGSLLTQLINTMQVYGRILPSGAQEKWESTMRRQDPEDVFHFLDSWCDNSKYAPTPFDLATYCAKRKQVRIEQEAARQKQLDVMDPSDIPALAPEKIKRFLAWQMEQGRRWQPAPGLDAWDYQAGFMKMYPQFDYPNPSWNPDGAIARLKSSQITKKQMLEAVYWRGIFGEPLSGDLGTPKPSQVFAAERLHRSLDDITLPEAA